LIDKELSNFSGMPMPDRESLNRMRNETVHQRITRINKEYYVRLDGCIVKGIFKGVSLKVDHGSQEQKLPWWDHSPNNFIAKTTGEYEKEILNYLKGKKFELFVNIGSADGYYLAGVYKANISKHVIGFEINKELSKISAQILINNGVHNSLILPKATVKSVSSVLTKIKPFGNKLMLIDIEGGEFDILSQELLKLLARYNFKIIIEIHHWVPNFLNKYERLLRDASHYFSLYALPRSTRYRNHEMFRFEHDDNTNIAMSEGRPSVQRFLLLE
jgi:hypothetical protein